MILQLKYHSMVIGPIDIKINGWDIKKAMKCNYSSLFQDKVVTS